jgi:hypothetical protein
LERKETSLVRYMEIVILGRTNCPFSFYFIWHRLLKKRHTSRSTIVCHNYFLPYHFQFFHHSQSSCHSMSHNLFSWKALLNNPLIYHGQVVFTLAS